MEDLIPREAATASSFVSFIWRLSTAYSFTEDIWMQLCSKSLLLPREKIETCPHPLATASVWPFSRMGGGSSRQDVNVRSL